MKRTLCSQTPSSHKCHCEKLKHPTLADHYSVTYGVNRDSVLNYLSYFHVCDSTLPPDLMHDVLEGYLPYTLKLMLAQFIDSRYFKLSELNTIISNFDYGLESSIPSPITLNTLRSNDSSSRTQFSQTGQ